MEVDPQIYEFGQSLLNNFDKERAEGILSKKMKELENQIDQQENNLLKPTDKDNLEDKYAKWDKIEQNITKREEFEKKAEKDRQDLSKNFMERMMGCDQNHSKEIDIYNRPFIEKMQIVKDFKEKGNDYFKEENYEKASYFYAKALLQFYYIIPENDVEEQEVNPIKLTCHLNQALCFYKQNRFDEGLTECYQALCIDPLNVKCLYRQSLLNRAKHNFEKAIEDVQKGLNIDPNNKSLKSLLKTLRDDMTEYIKTSKQVYGKMVQNSNQSKVVELPDEPQEPCKEQPKVVELIEEEKEITKTDSQLEDRVKQIETRLQKLEDTVNEIKICMELDPNYGERIKILKGYGAIPYKLPEVKEEIKEDKKEKIHKIDREEIKGNWTNDDCISIVSLVVLAIVLSVTFSVLLVKFTMVVQAK